MLYNKEERPLGNLIRKSLLRKMIEERHQITETAQAEIVQNKRDLWTIIERSLQIKNDMS